MSPQKICLAFLFLGFSQFACSPASSPSALQSGSTDKYGVMTGHLVSHKLEAEDGEGRWPHYVLEMETESGPARAVINFKSRYRQELQFRLIENLPQERFEALRNTQRFQALANNANSGALDYLRHPDLVSEPTDWLMDDAIDAESYLDQALEHVEQVMVYGYSFGNAEGMHRVHMEQGDPRDSSFAKTNKPWQDGALLYWREGDGGQQLDAFLVKFTKQSFCTNNKGKAIPC